MIPKKDLDKTRQIVDEATAKANELLANSTAGPVLRVIERMEAKIREQDLFDNQFRNHLPPEEQHQLQMRAAQVIVIGTLIVVSMVFYEFSLLIICVLTIPIILLLKTANKWEIGAAYTDLRNRLKHAPTLATLGMFLVIAFALVGAMWGISR